MLRWSWALLVALLLNSHYAAALQLGIQADEPAPTIAGLLALNLSACNGFNTRPDDLQANCPLPEHREHEIRYFRLKVEKAIHNAVLINARIIESIENTHGQCEKAKKFEQHVAVLLA